jgi:Flp pilus assembly pilin Flp
MLKRRDLLLNDSGATFVEYALILCVIALFAIAGATALGNNTSKVFCEVGVAIHGAGANPFPCGKP